MPRPIDHHERRLEIANAAIRILAAGGTQALTLKSLAKELGGSITLVTHFFSNRDELFVAITDELISSYDPLMEEVDHGEVGYDRLLNLLRWMVPTEEEDVTAETGRIALVPHRGEHDSIGHFFDAMEDRMRALLRERLRDLVPDDDLEPSVGYLRALTNGVTLSAVEHPDLWPPDRIEWVLERGLRGLGLPRPAGAPDAAAR
ncbi:TetR/AcrR family transcriptional regulator [Streptomyces sp. NPDC048277]|uniref:TetR/AcrR family transcriptional regulator n=1 Tax=Streptomyces sp. NPDC048277 TaxID=3155027 RepID=UPI00340B7BCC